MSELIPISFDRWMAEGRRVDDLGDAVADDGLDGVPGVVFPGGLYIEREVHPDRGWAYCLTYENTSKVGDELLPLAEELYRWAVESGIIEGKGE